MGNKARPNKNLNDLKNIIRTMWLFQGYSIRRIADEFNNNKEYVKEFGTVSVSSVGQYVKAAKKEAESWIDEDALEKYTAEFVRKQHTIDEEIEKLRKLQEMCDLSDPKDKELYLKISNAMHQMSMNQIKMMSDIELVIQVKKFNKERRIKNETIKLIGEDGKPVNTAEKRGYISLAVLDKTDADN